MYLVVGIIIIASAIGGHYLTTGLTDFKRNEITEESDAFIQALSYSMLNELNHTEYTVNALAQTHQLEDVLGNSTHHDIDDANMVLDNYQESFNVSVCYLMNLSGGVVASSNRESEKSFVGNNYGFRPYFQKAIMGSPTRYFALGITSGTRGFYASSPVTNENGTIIGVAVIKRELDSLEKEMGEYDFTYLVSPEGVIFLSCENCYMVNRTMGRLNDTTIANLRASREFGDGPFDPFIEDELKNGDEVEIDGKKYLVSIQEINDDGWSLYVFNSLDEERQFMWIGIIISILIHVIILGLFAYFIHVKTASVKLEESENRFHSLYDSMKEGVALHRVISDDSGVPVDYLILDVNPSYVSQTGVSREKALNRKASELYETGEPPYLNEYSHVAKTGEPNTFETYFPPLEKYFSISVISPQKDHFATVFTDITARKINEETIRENQSQLLAITSAAMDAIIKIDNHGAIDFWNDAATKIFGYRADEVMGRNLHDILVPEQYFEKHRTAFSLFQQSGKGGAMGRTTELTGKHKDGHEFPIELSLSSTKIKEKWNAIGIVRDISERKQAEEERDELMKLLEDKSEELQQVVYVTSHDLRSPLVNIQGFSDILDLGTQEILQLLENDAIPKEIKEKAEKISQDDITESITFIRASIDKIEALIDGLLRISRLGTASLNPEHLNMNDLLHEVEKTIEFRIKEKGVTLSIENLPDCRGDRMQVNQVFTNLLDNALKYLDPQRPGELRVSGREEDGNVIFSVEDNGVGIAPNHIDKVFQIFHRIDRSATDGEGLGLTAIRHIMDRHQGRTWVESEFGKGSTFSISFPMEGKEEVDHAG